MLYVVNMCECQCLYHIISPKNDVSCNDAKHIYGHIHCVCMYNYMSAAMFAHWIGIYGGGSTYCQSIKFTHPRTKIWPAKFKYPCFNTKLRFRLKILGWTKLLTRRFLDPVRMYVYGEHKLEAVMEFCMHATSVLPCFPLLPSVVEGKLCLRPKELPHDSCAFVGIGQPGPPVTFRCCSLGQAQTCVTGVEAKASKSKYVFYNISYLDYIIIYIYMLYMLLYVYIYSWDKRASMIEHTSQGAPKNEGRFGKKTAI
jgi:hypothetical protein